MLLIHIESPWLSQCSCAFGNSLRGRDEMNTNVMHVSSFSISSAFNLFDAITYELSKSIVSLNLNISFFMALGRIDKRDEKTRPAYFKMCFCSCYNVFLQSVISFLSSCARFRMFWSALRALAAETFVPFSVSLDRSVFSLSSS